MAVSKMQGLFTGKTLELVNKVPMKCPNCNGKGRLFKEKRISCGTCEGTGIVWKLPTIL